MSVRARAAGVDVARVSTVSVDCTRADDGLNSEATLRMMRQG